MMDRVRSFLEGHPRLSRLTTALDVQERFGEIGGGYVAAAVTLMAFLSVFPLVVVGSAVLGFVSVGRGDLTGQLIDALGLPRGGTSAEAIRDIVATAEDSRRAASLIGLGGLFLSSLGLVGALQHAYNSAWQVEGRGLKDKAFGMLWLVGAALLFVSSIGLTALAQFLPGPTVILGFTGGLALSFVLWWWSARVLANVDVGWRALVPGAVFGAVGMEILKVVGTVYVPRAVASSSAVYGSIGLVFALLAWLFVFGRVVVYSAVVSVVVYEHGEGTTTAKVEVPEIPDVEPGEATRGGRIEVA